MRTGCEKKRTIQKQETNTNEAGFINLRYYLYECNPDWMNQDCFLIMNAPRNIGKSYGAWEIIEKDIWIASNYTKRIAYCRTNKEKMLIAKENFNSKYRGKYFMNDKKIYKVTYGDDGKEIIKERIEIGSVVSLAQSENYKSAIFENYVLFFWDEYNELSRNKGLYPKFVDLLKTVKRQNSPFLVLLIGNKVNANSDILVKLKIDLKQIKDKENDAMIEIENNMYFIEIGNSTFKTLNPPTDLINRLASYDEETNNYLNEGLYLEEEDDSVLIYDYYVKPTQQVLKYFSYDDYKFEYGTFIMNEKKNYYFRDIKKIPDGEFAYSLSVIGDVRVQNAKLLEDDDMVDFADNLKNKAKRKILWYCSFETKEIIESYIKVYCSWEN